MVHSTASADGQPYRGPGLRAAGSAVPLARLPSHAMVLWTPVQWLDESSELTERELRRMSARCASMAS